MLEHTELSTALWNLDEKKGFCKIIASDGLKYSVLKTDNPQEDYKVAEILAGIRNAINLMLIYIYDNDKIWNKKKLEFTFCRYSYNLDFCHGIEHTLDLHIPNWKRILPLKIPLQDKLNLINKGKVFEYQEMPRNDLGILGLNKPKIIDRSSKTEGTYGRNGFALKRKILLTIRDSCYKIKSDIDIVELAVHELTHTTSNDVDWIDEKYGGNHQSPYVSFHRFMKQVAREVDFLKDSIYYLKKNN